MSIMILLNGDRYHYNIDGVLLNKDLTLVECADGTTEYYNHEHRHRSNGLPAIEYSNGDALYYENGKLHRLAGPAVDSARDKEWWVNGKQLDCTTQEEFEKLMKLKAFW